MKRSFKGIRRLVPLAIFIAIVFGIFTHADAIIDWYKLRGYTPPAAVASLAAQDTMTDKAKHMFYINHPVLTSDAAAFRSDCTQNEQTIVLGCYRSGESGIFVYNVQDPRLDGVQEVTAAHEMLHAAYERLSASEKKQVNSWLQDYYNNGLTDQRIKDTINAYKQTEPSSVVDEMHSVFGTEAANLPAPLENYYKQYFSNRAAVTAFAAGYESEFTSRINQINDYDSKLSALKAQIASLEQSLGAQSAQINSDRSNLDSQKAAGNYSAYNAGVAGFNSEVDSYNAGVSRLQSFIAQYNQMVSARNALASELRALDQSIDTRLTAQSAQ